MYKKLFIIFCLVTSKAFCESELYKNNEEIKQVLNQNPYEPSYLTMILGLFMVIALVYLTGFIYQKLVKFNAKFVEKEDDNKNSLEIKVVNCVSLGQNKYLHTIEHNGHNLLIASTPQNITLLKEYPKEKNEN